MCHEEAKIVPRWWMAQAAFLVLNEKIAEKILMYFQKTQTILTCVMRLVLLNVVFIVAAEASAVLCCYTCTVAAIHWFQD